MTDIERRRLGVFLAAAFGVSWTTAAVLWRTGGLVESPELAAGVTLATVLLAGPYMWGPAVGHLAARAATGEGFGWSATLLRPHLRSRWRLWLVGWLGPVVLVLAGAAVYFAVFPGRFGGLAAVADLLETVEQRSGTDVPLSPAAFVAVQFAAALLLAPLLNAFSTFGEEFGWRGYLLPKLAPLGWRRALLLHGAVWGVWHWPVVAMGHNYGFGYPGAPWTGLAAMTLFTVVLGVFVGWLALRGGSVWPAVLGHAVVNGFAAFPALFTRASTPLLGPVPTGVVAMLPALALAAWLLADPGRLAPCGEFEAALDGEM